MKSDRFDAGAVKLIVWDLDDTLWDGILAEGDDVRSREHVAAFIRRISEHGIVSSVCSKNDPERAKQKLVELGLWDYFVFPTIAFAAKGAAVRETIERAQLRPQNVVFVDDSIHNREEVKASCEGIMVVDASSPNALAQLIEQTLEAHGHVAKSRLADYKLLEAKHAQRDAHDGTNEDFLRDSDIHVCFVRRQDNLLFAERIEELVNRTNQMNFTKSRVRAGEIRERITMNDGESEAVFVWDKFGYYGLVGFYTVAGGKIEHLTFSCRVMNMRVEHVVARRIEKMYKLRFGLFPIELHDFITVKTYFDAVARELIMKHERPASGPVLARVMANCQSAAIADFSGMADRLDYDNWPRVFSLRELEAGDPLADAPPLLVYGGFIDFDIRYWDGAFDLDRIRRAVTAFCRMLAETGRHALVFLPSDEQLRAQPQAQALLAIAEAWREQAVSERLTLLPTENEGGRDFRHFSRRDLHKMGQQARSWLERHKS